MDANIQSCRVLMAAGIFFMLFSACIQGNPIQYPPSIDGIVRAYLTPSEDMILVISTVKGSNKMQCLNVSGKVVWSKEISVGEIHVRFFGENAIVIKHEYDKGISVLWLNWRSGDLSEELKNAPVLNVRNIVAVDSNTVLTFSSNNHGHFVSELNFNKDGFNTAATHKCLSRYSP
jgi:hypothetical protein